MELNVILILVHAQGNESSHGALAVCDVTTVIDIWYDITAFVQEH